MVYRRYGGSADSVLAMPFFDGCELIGYAVDAENEDRLFLRWAAMYQARMGFDEFRRALGETQEGEIRTESDILKTVREIIG